MNELHQFDPNSGFAIIKVGEYKPTGSPGAFRVEYSWREWNIAKNRQVRLLRLCGPFEPFEGKGSK